MTETNSDERELETSSLLNKATWSGAVCALAVVLTSLNLVPPVNVQYKVRTQVIVAPPRFQQLMRVFEQDRKVIQSGKLKYVQLYDLRKLDGAKGDDLILVELESLWTGRASQAHIESWLAAISKAESRAIVNSEVAREGRFARWQTESAKHYLNRHLYLSSNDTPATSTISTKATTATRVPAKFAALSNPELNEPADSVLTPAATNDQKSLELQLAESVKQSELELGKTEKIFQSALEKYAGAIELVGAPRIRSKISPIASWMSASVIVLALATGSVFSLLQYRAQSGGAYDPKFVANQLAIDGLPVLDEINLSTGSSNDSMNVFVRLGRCVRSSSLHLARASEWLVAIWCCAIAYRMLFDPLWRGVVFESPLAAFGRLVTGMP